MPRESYCERYMAGENPEQLLTEADADIKRLEETHHNSLVQADEDATRLTRERDEARAKLVAVEERRDYYLREQQALGRLLEQTRAERDEWRHEARQAHGVAQALERQVLSQQEACAKASLAVAELARERDEARAEVARQHEGWTDTYAQLDLAARDCDRLRALLRDVADYCAGARLDWGASGLADRITAALEGRDE